MIRLDADCETKIHHELKLDEVIKTIPTNVFNAMSTDRGVHPSQTVDWYRVVTPKAKIMDRLQKPRTATVTRNQGMNVTLTQVCDRIQGHECANSIKAPLTISPGE